MLEKDFGNSIRSGFETTGLFPLSAARGLAKLPTPVEEREVETLVQQQLLEKLSTIRYNPAPNKQAQRPSKKDKLPAGASFTCAANEESDEDSDASSSSSEESESEKETETEEETEKEEQSQNNSSSEESERETERRKKI